MKKRCLVKKKWKKSIRRMLPRLMLMVKAYQRNVFGSLGGVNTIKDFYHENTGKVVGIIRKKWRPYCGFIVKASVTLNCY